MPVTRRKTGVQPTGAGYDDVLASLVRLVGEARGAATRSLIAVMTAAYWEIGRHIVEHEQRGTQRAGYGEALLERLSADLTKRFGRGFSTDRLETSRLFYLAYPSREISATVSRISDNQLMLQGKLASVEMPRFALSWSHAVTRTRHQLEARATGKAPRRRK